MEMIYGRHSVRAVFLTRPKDIQKVLIYEGQRSALNEEFIELTKSTKVKPTVLTWNAFLKETGLTEDAKHQGICVFTKPRTIYIESDLDSLRDTKLVLALDQLSDPRNLGSILRSAAFFDVDAVLLQKDRSVDVTPTATRIAVGGAEYIKIFRVINLARSLEQLKKAGFWVYGLDERGKESIEKVEFADKTVIVVGAEGQGMRARTKEFCDVLVSIPGGRKGIESLNAGVAAAVALSHIK